MQTKLIIIILSILVSGCLYQNADITDIKKAEYFCTDKLGVKLITIVFHGREVVYCVDGSTKVLSQVNLPNAN